MQPILVSIGCDLRLVSNLRSKRKSFAKESFKIADSTFEHETVYSRFGSAG